MPESSLIRCLLVDDDEGARHLTQSILEEIPWADFDLDWVATFGEGKQAIERQEHDVYLIDYQLSDRAGTGIDLVREARENGHRAPMILLTGKGGYDVDLAALEAGLSDYLDKSRVDRELLSHTIRYAMERARSQAALRESEARHRSMFDHLPVGLFRTSPEGELMHANPALLELLGSPSRDTLEFEYARNFFVSPAHMHGFAERLAQIGVVRAFESDLKLTDGSLIRVRCTARAHRAEDGTIVYFEGILEDASDELAVGELHAEAERFRFIYRESNQASVLLDLQGHVRDFNPAFQRAFGYRPGELTGRYLPDLVEQNERDSLAEEIRVTASGGGNPRPSRRGLRTSDGRLRRAQARLGAVRSRMGNPDHILMLFEDVEKAV